MGVSAAQKFLKLAKILKTQKTTTAALCFSAVVVFPCVAKKLK
jgi:hypothetical protein